MEMIVEPIGKQPLLPGQFTAAVWGTVAPVMQGTVSTALWKAFCVPDMFCAELEKPPLRHTDCLYNRCQLRPHYSWSEGALASQTPPASLLLAAEHPQMYSLSGSAPPRLHVLSRWRPSPRRPPAGTTHTRAGERPRGPGRKWRLRRLGVTFHTSQFKTSQPPLPRSPLEMMKMFWNQTR